MKSLLWFIIPLFVICLLEALALWFEWEILRPIFIRTDLIEWLVIIVVGVFWGIAALCGFILERIHPDGTYNKKRLRQITIQRTKPAYITTKPLGGFKREQQNEIFLIGTALHNLYISDASHPLSEKQKEEALNIHMRFFITVYPPNRTRKEYFDYLDKFQERNSNISHLSVSEKLDRSIEIISNCDTKQIKKLKNLFQALRARYEGINKKKRMTMISFAETLDNKLAALMSETYLSKSEEYDEWIG